MKKYAVIKLNEVLYICNKLENAEKLASQCRAGVYTVYGETKAELLEYAKPFFR